MMRAKRALAAAGLQETLNYSATSKDWLAKFGLQATVKIQNPITEDMQYMTPALLPLLVKNAQDQERHHFGSEPLATRLFEIRPAFFAPAEGVLARSDLETSVTEYWRVGFALAGPRYAGGLKSDLGAVEFPDMKGVFEQLMDEMGTKGVRLQRLADGPAPGGKPNPWMASLKELFHPGQSVEVLTGQNSIGFFGLLHPRVSRELKLRNPLWVAELDWRALLAMSRGAFTGRAFKPWSEFPPMERDYALLVKSDIPAEKVVQVALKAGKPIAKSAKVFDIYRGAQVAEGMTSVAVRVIFQEDQRSLQDAETEGVSAKILEAWRKELGAELRG
jgi:phenylalanyl-tRNA synthetase beta chain